MKTKPIKTKEPFGKRLARLRKAKGLTQVELAKLIGVTQRVISYYERRSPYLPSNLLFKIAKVLKIPVDELIGTKEIKDRINPKHPKLWRKLIQIEKLPEKDRKAIMHMVNTLLSKHKPRNSI